MMKAGGAVYYFTTEYKKPNKIRCPICRKYLTPQTFDYEPFGYYFEPGYKVPPHKTRIS